ncbi:MAG: hypothetical protein HW388_461 [Dehalococcoidia bacterium]|nr:hypothetical protein [Dehalococcoidia bacterium]
MIVGLMAFYIVPRLLGIIIGIIILLGLMELVSWASYNLGIWPVGALFRVLEWVVFISAGVWMWNYVMNVLKAHKAFQEMKMRPVRGGVASEALSESQLASKRDEAISLIRHLQKMLAYQQLSMERYNGAAALASGSPPGSGMAVERPLFSVQSRTLVSQYMIPALEYKIELICSMKDEHEQVGQLVTEEIRRPYDEMSVAINMMLERANLQYQGFTSFEQNSDLAWI